MTRLNFASLASCLGLAASLFPGCGCNGNTGSTGTGQFPYRDQWRVEAEVPFEVGTITNIAIGNATEVRNNFMNRGDVIVKFADTDKITIEMRRFTMASNEDLAQEDFDALELWAYATSPQRPEDIPAESDCTQGVWKDNCNVLVYYQGLSQLERSGADLRVTLPRAYRHALDIETADNDFDSDYHNRGNVCVENINASVDIELGSGEAFVIVADDVTPMPRCSADNIRACEEWVDEMGNPAPWANACPCIAEIGEFGRVGVTSKEAAAADVTVDVPSGLWTAVRLSNEAPGQDRTKSCDASESDETCCATVALDNYTIDPSIGDDTTREPWRNQGSANYPGAPAVADAGFAVQATSKECSPVTSTEDPGNFVGRDNGTMQDTVERGNLHVCSGCLRGTGCDSLVSD